MNKNLLLLSSSRVAKTLFLEHAIDTLRQFLGQCNATKNLLFIPYAGISIGFDPYEQMVKQAFAQMDMEINSIHRFSDKKNAILNSSGIVTGGGNTFALLNSLYWEDLIPSIQSAVAKGKPYIGWSAGSNIAGPTISTTNDMPIVQPRSFDALNLLPWQLNPHFIEKNPAGHNGETRQQRLEEYLIMNPSQKVIALPEGTGLKQQDAHLQYFGSQKGYIFSKNNKVTIDPSSDLTKILS